MSQDYRGAAPDPSEMLVTILTIAGLTKDLQQRTAAQQNEIQRALESLISIRKQIDQQGQELRRTYAPGAVQQTVENARRVLAEFRCETAVSVDQLKKQIRAATWPLSLRVAGIAMVPIVLTLLGLLGIVGFARHFIPSLDAVNARQAVLATQPIQPIDHDGGKWVLVTETQTLCESGNRKRCAQYGRVQ